VANFLENLKRVPSFQEPKVEFAACGGAGGAQLYCFKMSFVFSALDKTQPPDPSGPKAPAAPAPGTGTGK